MLIGHPRFSAGAKLLMSTDRPSKPSQQRPYDTSSDEQPQYRNASNNRSRHASSGSRAGQAINIEDSDEESSGELKASTSRLPLRERSPGASPTTERRKAESAGLTGALGAEQGFRMKRKKSADSVGEGSTAKLPKDASTFRRREDPPSTNEDSIDELDLLSSSHKLHHSFSPPRPAGQSIASKMGPKTRNDHLGSSSQLKGSLAEKKTLMSAAKRNFNDEKRPASESQLTLRQFRVGDIDAKLPVDQPVIKYWTRKKDFDVQWTDPDGPRSVKIALADLDGGDVMDPVASDSLLIQLMVNPVSQTAKAIQSAFPDWDARSSCAGLTVLASASDEGLADYKVFRTWLKSGSSQNCFGTIGDPAAKAILGRSEGCVTRRRNAENPAEETSSRRKVIHDGVVALSGNASTSSTHRGDQGKTPTSSTNFSPTTVTSSRPKARPIVSTSAPVRQTRSTSGGQPLFLPTKNGEMPAAAVEPPRRRPERTTDALKLRYPFDGPGSVSVFESDCDRLEEGEFLNDTLVEFGLKIHLASVQKRNPELYDSMYVFNTFLYRQLTKVRGKQDAGYQQVRKWTAKTNIFEKKFLVLPINENLHWYLAIVINPGKALDFVKAEDDDTSSGEGVGVKTRGKQNGSRRSSLAEEESKARQGSAARSETFGTPELPSEKQKEAQLLEVQQKSSKLLPDGLAAQVDDTGVEASYSQMSIGDRAVKDARAADARQADLNAPEGGEATRHPNVFEDDVNDAVHYMEQDTKVESGTTPPGTPPSSNPPPSEPEPVASQAKEGSPVAPTEKGSSHTDYIPTGLNGTIFAGQSFLGFGDAEETQQNGVNGLVQPLLSAPENRPAELAVEGEVIAISDDEDNGSDKDLSMHDVSSVTNIHNKGRGTLFGGGPLPSSSLGTLSPSPPMPAKKPVSITPGESMNNWNKMQSPPQPAKRSLPSASSSRSGGTASAASFYASTVDNKKSTSARVPTYDKRVDPGKRILSNKRLAVSSSDEEGDVSVPEASQEPRLPGRIKRTSPVDLSLSTEAAQSAKPKPQRAPSASALANVAKRREQLEGLVVLTFDSLGGRHPAVQTAVKNYLRNEAWDKKQLRIDPQPAYIDVNVPGQSNWCDCGLFVLLCKWASLSRNCSQRRCTNDFLLSSSDLISDFDRFFSNPSHFINEIIPERDDEAEAWQAESAGQARKNLRKLVDGLSEEWLERKKKVDEEAKAAGKGSGEEGAEGDSQSDVEVVPEVKSSPEKVAENGTAGVGLPPPPPPQAHGEREEGEENKGGDEERDDASMEAHPSTSPV